jgi:rhamnulokinase
MLGRLDDSSAGLRLDLEEIHRFEHRPCSTPTGPVWDVTGIWRELLKGLQLAIDSCRRRSWRLASIGVDTWGVDWALLGVGGELLTLPHCYRDSRNLAACEKVLNLVGGYESLYQRTGIQRLPFNTLFQLHAARTAEPRLFDAARRVLFLPDLFHYWLSGEAAVERTVASTSGMLNVQSGDWDRELAAAVDIDPRLLGPVAEAGSVLGGLRKELLEELGAPPEMQVVLPASHDTASAVAAVPAGSDAGFWVYLSSGTWSLLGAELFHPIITREAARVPFTHESGIGGSIRFLKNIAGLWLVQELRRELEAAGECRTYEELGQLVSGAEPFRTLINPNDPRFVPAGSIRCRIAHFARQTAQPTPENTSHFVRTCLESLALCYGQTTRQLAEVVGREPSTLHIVGGGSKVQLLNEFTAANVDFPVRVGPIEATAVGNVLVQAMGCGVVPGPAELRGVVSRSFDIGTARRTTRPEDWLEARERFERITTNKDH